MSGTAEDRADVVVVGAGIAGLVVGRALAAAGRSVVVLDERDAPGGSVRAHTVAGLVLDAGAESFATRGDIVSGLLGDLGLADSVCLPAGVGAWVELPTGPRPMPRGGVLGLPAHPFAAEVRHTLGPLGTARAAVDLIAPARLGARATTLGGLVRARMGARVVDRMIRPVVGGIHGADPDAVALAALAPHLATALGAGGGHGSLTRAVRQVQTAAPSGSAVQGLVGGMHRLTDALVDGLLAGDGELRVRTRATTIDAEPGGWRVAVPGGSVHARQLVLAAPPADGLPGLQRLAGTAAGPAGTGPAATTPALDPGAATLLVTLVLDDHRLDDAPRGTGVLVAPGVSRVRATALTHATAKWAWLAEAAGPGRHVLRLSYKGADDLPSDRDALLALALADAATLLGCRLDPAGLVGHDVVRWTRALPRPSAAHVAAVTAVRAAAAGMDGLHVTGGWVAGSGLAAVVADARATAAAALG